MQNTEKGNNKVQTYQSRQSPNHLSNTKNQGFQSRSDRIRCFCQDPDPVFNLFWIRFQDQDPDPYPRQKKSTASAQKGIYLKKS